MGNFEKLSVLVIVVIIVMILVVALYTWTDNPDSSGAAATDVAKAEQPAAMDDMVKSPFPPASASAVAPGPGVKPVDPKAPKTPLAPEGKGVTAKDVLGVGPVAPPSMAIPGTEPARDGLAGATGADEPKIHVVASGETLSKIAKTYLGSSGPRAIDAIAKANPGLDVNLIRPGMKLTIPSAKDLPAAAPKAVASEGKEGKASDGERKTVASKARSGSSIKPGEIYTVRAGDKLPDISRRAFGSSEHWHLIWLENFTAIGDPDVLPAGTRLKIPASTR